MLDQILGWTATIIFTGELIPQYIKTLKTKTVKGVSIWQYLLFAIGNIIALIYAIMIKQEPLIIKYVLAILSVMLYFIIYYKIRSKNDSNI